MTRTSEMLDAIEQNRSNERFGIMTDKEKIDALRIALADLLRAVSNPGAGMAIHPAFIKARDRAATVYSETEEGN